MTKKLTQEEFIERANIIHGNAYDYSRDLYTGSKNKFTIYCKEHRVEFTQKPTHHLSGRTGCKKCSVLKIKKTNVERYGVEHPLQSKEIKKKVKKTNLKRYGVEHPSQSKEMQEKIKQTNLERYGVEHVFQSKKVKEKVKKTNLERYEVENPSQSKEVKEKKKQTSLERYGVENPLQSEEIKEKIKETNLERYGVEHPSQSKEVKEKKKQTSLERYGVENPLQSEEIKEKIKETNLERYGVEHPLQSEEIKEKLKETNLERYGVEHVFQSKEVKEKTKETNLNRYGVENSTQSHISKESLGLLNNPKWLKKQHHINELTLTKISEIIGVNGTTVARYCRKHNIEVKYFEFSMGEKEVLEYLTTILPPETIIHANIRTIITPYELDIYIPEYNLAIEYNGEYWHRNSQEKDALKEQLCEEQGITILTIWENQWLTNPEMMKTVLMEICKK